MKQNLGTYTRIFREQTNDHGIEVVVYARDNNAQYALTSARAKDKYSDYLDAHDCRPTAAWLRKHIQSNR